VRHVQTREMRVRLADHLERLKRSPPPDGLAVLPSERRGVAGVADTLGEAVAECPQLWLAQADPVDRAELSQTSPKVPP
jgi:hypothetical protein